MKFFNRIPKIEDNEVTITDTNWVKDDDILEEGIVKVIPKTYPDNGSAIILEFPEGYDYANNSEFRSTIGYKDHMTLDLTFNNVESYHIDKNPIMIKRYFENITISDTTDKKGGTYHVNKDYYEDALKYLLENPNKYMIETHDYYFTSIRVNKNKTITVKTDYNNAGSDIISITKGGVEFFREYIKDKPLYLIETEEEYLDFMNSHLKITTWCWLKVSNKLKEYNLVPAFNIFIDNIGLSLDKYKIMVSLLEVIKDPSVLYLAFKDNFPESDKELKEYRRMHNYSSEELKKYLRMHNYE